MSLPKPRETDLVQQCLQWLKLKHPHGVWWRQNAGATKIGGRFIRFNTMDGVSDIIGIYPGLLPDTLANTLDRGRFCAFECKMPAGRVSPAQAVFLESVRNAGGIAGVVRNIEDLELLLKGNG